MTPEQQDATIDDIVERVLDLPAAEQQAALERLTVDQPEVRARAASLLAKRSTNSFRELLPSTPIKLTPSPTAPTLPSIPGYEIVEQLGRGGMGAVYKARQQKLGRLVALKVILHGEYADQTDRQRFQNEAEAIARLQHPHIVQIFEAGVYDGRPYLALEYAPGGSLDRQLRGTPRLPKQAAAEVRTLALALQHAHQRGIIHRDLKPANVLLGEGGALKVTDFGLARLDEGGDQTRSNAVLGTPSYMAPEQAAGHGKHVGPAADVYALGAILYEALTGRAPFKAATVADTLLQVIHQEPVSPRRLNPQVPRDLETVCLKCLRKEPAQRYASAGELADDLGRFLDGRPVVARPIGRVAQAAKWARRNPVVSALIAATIVAIVTGLAAFGWQYEVAVDNEREAKNKALEAQQATARAIRGEEAAKEKTKLAEKRAEELRVALDDKQRALAASERARVNSLLTQADQAWRLGYTHVAHRVLDDVPDARRGWAWNYLERRFQGALFTTFGNRDIVVDLAFSPDGKLLAAIDEADHIHVWDAASGLEAPLCRGGLAGGGFVAFAPDGRSLFARAPRIAGRTVRRWDMTTGKQGSGPAGWAAGAPWPEAVSPDGKRLAAREVSGTLRIQDADGPPVVCAGSRGGGMHHAAFSPDGSLLALAAAGKVRVWNTASGELVQTLKQEKGLQCAAFSPDGRSLAAGGGRFGGVSLWDVRTGQAGAPFGPTNVFTLAFSPDGEWLAAAVLDGEIHILEVRTGAVLSKLRGHQKLTRALAFSPDGQRLASGGADHTVRVWDLRPLAPTTPLSPKARPVLAVHDETFARLAVLTSDDVLRVLDRASGAELFRVERLQHLASSVVALSPDGSRLAYAPRPGVLIGHAVLLRSVPDGWDLPLVRLPAYADAIAFSPDGSELSVISPTEGPRRGIQRADVKGKLRTVWEKSNDYWGVGSLAYTPDNRSLVAGFSNGKIRIWDRKTGRLDGLLTGHSDRVNCLAIGPDARLLVSGGRDRGIILWDLPGRKELLRLGGHEQGVAQVALSPDGQQIASLGAGGELNLWDAVNGQQLLTLDAPQDRALRIGFARDGGRLLGLTSAGDVVQWEGAPAPFRRTLRGHDNKVAALGFSPDGRILASVAAELRWWDVATGRALFSGERLSEFATAVAFRPDGRQLGFATIQKNVQVWDVNGRTKLADFKVTMPPRRLALSPQAGVLATWEDDRSLAVWEFPAGRQRFRVAARLAGFPEVAFSGDGRRVAVTDLLGNRLVWEAATGKPVPVPADLRLIPPASHVSPDGRLFALPELDLIHLVTLQPQAPELERRRAATRLDIGWQNRQAQRHEAAKHWFAAVTHLNALIRERPDDAELQARRMKALAALAEADRQ